MCEMGAREQNDAVAAHVAVAAHAVAAHLRGDVIQHVRGDFSRSTPCTTASQATPPLASVVTGPSQWPALDGNLRGNAGWEARGAGPCWRGVQGAGQDSGFEVGPVTGSGSGRGGGGHGNRSRGRRLGRMDGDTRVVDLVGEAGMWDTCASQWGEDADLSRWSSATVRWRRVFDELE